MCPVVRKGVGLRRPKEPEMTKVPSRWLWGSQGIIEKKRCQEKTRGIAASWSNFWCRRLQNEDFYEEVSDQEDEVGQQEEVIPAGAVAAVAPRNVEVPEVLVNPESPSPVLSDDGLFMTIYDPSELQLLKDWMEHNRFMRGGVRYLVVEPLITSRFNGFLQFLYSPQWEDKLLTGNEMLLAKLGAYVCGYSLLTGFQRSQWDRLFPAWTSAELRSQLIK